MRIQLSDHFTTGRLIRFVIPSIAMMVFTSIYCVVDGFFVSNFVGKIPFAAVNLIFPVIQMLGTIGFMLGTGGSALVSMLLGEGQKEKASKVFSLMVYMAIILGGILGILGFSFMEPIAIMLGAKGEMVHLCVVYGRIIIGVLPTFMLQVMFQSFLVTAEKPNLGLILTIAAGVCNMILDWLFMAVFHMGLPGAALATALSQAVGGILPLIYFVRKNDSALRLVKFEFDGRAMLKACVNGSSELVSNISMSVVAILYNFQLLRFAGENGVAAYGVLMYVNFIFISIFLGYSIGVAPIIGYNYGAGNHGEMKNIFKKSSIFVLITGGIMACSAYVLAPSVADIFVGYDSTLCAITVYAFRATALSFFFAGIGIFASSMFTALNDGLISALISFLRTLVFQVAAILIMPIIWGINGVWHSVVVAEVLATVVAVIFIIKFRKKYHYF